MNESMPCGFQGFGGEAEVLNSDSCLVCHRGCEDQVVWNRDASVRCAEVPNPWLPCDSDVLCDLLETIDLSLTELV